ncbi:MAG: DUF2683 family protein [Methanobacteriota archaeon]
MVKAMVDIETRTNQVLNIVKAQYGLNDKSEAIDKVVEIFEMEIMEPELRPDYVKKIAMVRKEKGIPVESFADRYGLS